MNARRSTAWITHSMIVAQATQSPFAERRPRPKRVAPMTDAQTAPNLQVLQDTYEILGELRTGERARTYMAKRRADGANVTILVVGTPTGGENNALSHFAADTQLLSKSSHPQMPRVIEGRWVGKDQFAVVTERRPGTSLGELLGRGERFTPPRISAILRDVDNVIAWARSNGVVHRGVSPDTVLFERDTNRVWVTLEPTLVPAAGVPDAGADARTLGTLAWSMLTGKEFTDALSLAALRSDLAKRVVDDTEVMLRSKSGGEVPDTQSYIAVIASADALKAGELEIAEIQAHLTDERRAELEQFELEQKAFALRNAELEQKLSDERREFEQRMAEEGAQLSALKAEFTALKSNSESQLGVERSQFEQERQELEQERLAFEQKAAAREAELEAKAAAVERLRAEEGQRIDAAIAAAVETVAATTVVPPREEDSGEAWKTPSSSVEPDAWVDETVRKHSVGAGEPELAAVAAEPGGRPRWMIPAVAAAVVLVLVTLFASTRQPGTASSTVDVGKTAVVPTAPTTDVRGTPKGGFLTQSAGGTVGPAVAQPFAAAGAPTPGAPAQSLNTDSVARAARQTTAAENAAAKPRPKPKPVEHRVDVDSSSAGGAGDAFSAEADAIRRADAARRDSLARRDSAAKAKPDTTGKTRPDTTVKTRPDTSAAPGA
jgi:hypothetical protein